MVPTGHIAVHCIFRHSTRRQYGGSRGKRDDIEVCRGLITGRKMEMGGLQKWWHNRWLVLVAALWMQSCAGIGYVFGSLSPAIKSSLHYNQKQINRLAVAKDIGGSVGLLAGTLCEILPTWGILLVGALQNLAGYGWLWLVVLHTVPTLPFWGVISNHPHESDL